VTTAPENRDNETALLIEVPAAEPVVGRYRARFDGNAALGVPAHITVLAPFMPARRLDVSALGRLARLFATVKAFDCELDHADWFGSAVLWLGPRDPLPFQHLTELVFRAFPEFPPFEGQFDEVIPHLTVGYDHPLEELRAAERLIAPSLPVSARVTAVTLMRERAPGGRWRTHTRFPLS
jgi:2'-5' RNA ligase